MPFGETYNETGRGLYVTSFPKQAERWAVRKSMRSGKGRPTVNVYDLKDDYNGYNVLNFRDPEDDEEWLDFVCDYRNSSYEVEGYDAKS